LPENRDGSTDVDDPGLEPRAQSHSDPNFGVAVATATSASLLDSSASWDEPSPHLSLVCHAASFIVDCVNSRCGYCAECVATT